MKRAVPALAALILLGTLCLVPTILAHWRVDSSTDSLVLEADPEALRYDRNALIFANDEFVLVGLQRDDLFTPAGIAAVDSLQAEFSAIQIASVDTAGETVNPIASVWSITQPPVFLLRSFQEPKAPMAALMAQATLGAEGIDLVKAREELTHHELFAGNLISQDGKTAGILVTLRQRPQSADDMRRRLRLFDRRGLAQERLASDDPQLRAAAARELVQVQDELDAFWPQWVASELLRKEERIRALAKIEAVIEKAKSEGHTLGRSGVPAIVVDMVKAIESDFEWFFGLALGFVFLFLLAVFRRLRWVLLPLCATGATVIWTLFGMQFFDKKLTVITANVPALLLVIGLAHSIHLVVRYRELLARFPEQDSAARVGRLVRGLVWPCLFTATTTAAGFASLYYAGSRPIIDFGFFMAAGVGLSFLFSFLILPAGMLALPVAPEGKLERSAQFLSGLGRVSLGHPGKVLGVTAVLVGLACWGITRIEVEARFIDYFRPSSPIHQGLKYVDQNLGGTSAIEIVIDGRKGGAFGPLGEENLAKAAAVVDWLEARPEVGAVMSFPGLIDEARKLIPTWRRGQAGGALVFQLGPEILRAYVVTEERQLAGETVAPFSRVRITARVKETHPDLKRHEFLRDLHAFLAQTFPPTLPPDAPEGALPLKAETTGMFVLYANMLASLAKTQVTTSLLALAAIWVMLSLLFRNPFAALLALIPNGVPIALVLGAMGWSGIPLDMATVMIASVSLGIGVDCAIHYLFRYREEIAKDGDIAGAIERSHGSIGTSILYTSLTSVVGFVVLVVSEFLPNAYFGLFTAFAMVAALFAMLTLLPVLISLTSPFAAIQRAGLSAAASAAPEATAGEPSAGGEADPPVATPNDEAAAEEPSDPPGAADEARAPGGAAGDPSSEDA